jgi:Trk K+ transport system NAD-binding subunit
MMKNPSQIKKIILFRIIPIVTILSIALYAFNNGVVVETRRAIGSDSFIIQFYYAISLFFLNGLDMGMPEGGNDMLRKIFLVCYFVAPLMTAIAIIEALVLSLKPERLRRKLKNHIIFVGSGNLTLKEVKRLENETIIVVDKDSNHKNQEELKLLVTEYIIGNIKDESIQKRVNINEAKQIFLFTNKDEVNINTALNLKNDNIIVRAENLEMIDLFKDRFNIRSVHEENAICLINSSNLLSKSKIVIYGFGRFGQNILRQLCLNKESLLNEVIIVDSQINRQWYTFKYLLEGDFNFERTLIEKNQLDYSVLNDLEENTSLDKDSALVFCISHDNYNNIKTANVFRKHYKEPSIYIRSAGSAIEDEICKSSDISIFQ